MKKILSVALLVYVAACTPVLPGYLVPVESYLTERVGDAYFGGKDFCAYDVLGADMRSDTADIYVWALCGEYYLDKNVLTLGTASSLPVALHLMRENGRYVVTGHELPREGTDYGPSIQEIFPTDAIEKMCMTNPDCYNERAERLEKVIEQQAQEYYRLK